MFWPNGVPRYVETPSELVHASIARWAREAADKVAVRAGNDSLTYSELERRSANVTSRILSAQHPGGLMGLDIPNSVEAVTGLVAILKAGLIFQHSTDIDNPDSTLGMEDIRRWSAGEKLSEGHKVDLAPSEAAFGCLQGETSASISRSHECYVSSLASFTTFIGIGSDSTTLIPYRITSNFGTFALFCALYAGGTAVLVEGVSSLENELPAPSNENWCFAKIEDLLGSAKKFRTASSKSGCNYLVACESSPSAGTEKRIEKMLDSELLTMYYSEATGVAICRHPSWYLPSSVGIPVTNFEVRIGLEYYGNLFEMVNPDMKGEVLISGPMIDPVRYGRLDETVGIVGYTNSWARARERGMLDHNGLFYLEGVSR